MKGARLPANVTALGRVRRWTPKTWKPKTHEQAWLFAPLGPLPMGLVIAVCIRTALYRWNFPLLYFAMGYPVSVVVQGLGWSYDVHQRERAHWESTEP
jgi:hypothetical protein